MFIVVVDAINLTQVAATTMNDKGQYTMAPKIPRPTSLYIDQQVLAPARMTAFERSAYDAVLGTSGGIPTIIYHKLGSRTPEIICAALRQLKHCENLLIVSNIMLAGVWDTRAHAAGWTGNFSSVTDSALRRNRDSALARRDLYDCAVLDFTTSQKCQMITDVITAYGIGHINTIIGVYCDIGQVLTMPRTED